MCQSIDLIEITVFLERNQYVRYIRDVMPINIFKMFKGVTDKKTILIFHIKSLNSVFN